ncbi:transcriptional regulator, LacI family [Streptomyces iranensis]|uniref:Transcriptional regulator, LacI family n=1 Tax=Streptomyces iranensis TaxID=576784 RepID=A0A060ZP95_9ACTN|nr:transcriptional regulator, LacI family [Streptomyces iranensis]
MSPPADTRTQPLTFDPPPTPAPAAARLLLARCGEDVEEAALDDRPRLVVRESTGPAPG